MPTFITPPGRDPELMNKYGLGGIAVVDDLVFTGGMALDLATLTRLPGADTIADETRMCFAGIERNLGAAGCTLRDVARITCYVTDGAYRAEMSETLKELFEPGPYPKQFTVTAGIAADCRVEFEVLAVLPDAAAPASGARQLLGAGPGPAAGGATDRLVFTSGLAIDPETMTRVPEADSILDEVRVCLERIERTLDEVDLTLTDLAKVTAWVSEEQHRLDFAFAYRDLLAPGPYASRALFATGLAGDCRVQIDAIAHREARA